jgi:hypothetical protein
MAQIRQFRCPGCAYCAEVSGGEDRGLELYTQTIVCDECKELHDVPVRRFEIPSEDRNLFPDPSAKPLMATWMKFKMGEVSRKAKPDTSPAQFPHLQHYWKQVQLRCPKNHYHRPKTWYGMHLPLEEEFAIGGDYSVVEDEEQRASGLCPRCGSRMIRSQPLATWE